MVRVKAEVAGTLNSALDKAMSISRPAAIKHIQQSRRTRPDATPAEIIGILERRFIAATVTTGAASGATAVAPNGVSVAAAVADAGGFLGLSMLHVMALAEIHEIEVADLERKRTLLMGVLLGNQGSELVTKAAGRTGAHWGKAVVQAVPLARIQQVNKVLGPNFVTRYGTRQGILVLGKQVPAGIGAVIGAAGNGVFARSTVSSARKAFGEPPASWPAHLALRPAPEAPKKPTAILQPE